MKFIEVVECFQALEQEPSRSAMTKLLAQLLANCTAQQAQVVAYLAMGSLLPVYQNQQFKIASKGMIKILAALFNLPEDQIDQKHKELGDLGLVAQYFCTSSDQGLSLLEMYDQLRSMVNIVGTGSTEKKSQHLVALLAQLDPQGVKFVVRIVTGTMRLGCSEMTFIDALSWMLTADKSKSKIIEHAYNVCADLGLVAYNIKQQGIEGAQNMSITVGIPIRPAAAERLASTKDIIEKLGPCVAQPKLDGFRVQVHVYSVNGIKKVSFFSRNLLDMSDMFPELAQVCLDLPVDNLICEGEAIVHDEQTQTFLPFQQTVKRKRKHDVAAMSEQLPLRLYLFDLLYLNNLSMLDKTHQQRRQALLKVCKNVTQRSLQVIEERHVSTAQQLDEYFLTCIGAGLEGLVVKREDSVYQPGKRNFNWIKLKRESHGSLLDSIDGVILGYYVGQGKRAKFGIGAFLLGVSDQKTGNFVTVAKVGTGLTDQGWKDLKQRCDRIAVPQAARFVLCAPELAPDVWVQPEIVCTVTAEEITRSPLHTAGKTKDQPGYGLRFPRFTQYRDDKSIRDVTTVEEVERLHQEQGKVA